MKKINLFCFILTLSIIGITSCRKPEKEYHYLNQTIKDYTVFPVNSYWVYNDSITNMSDSIIVLNIEQDFYRRFEDNDLYEYILSDCYSSMLNKHFDRETFVDQFSIDNSCVYAENDIGKFINNNQLENPNSTIIYKDFYDSIIIRNITYYKVLVFSSVRIDTSFFYFAKNVGLIKQKSDSGVVELAHYHINY